MSRVLALVVIASSGLVLLACNKPQAPAPTPKTQAASPPAAPAPPPVAPIAPALAGFFHQPGHDVFGYYLPQTALTIGKYRLRELHLGGADEFESYEKGQRISPNYAPIMLEFDDTTSPQHENELGQPYHEVSGRVLPSAYRVTAQSVQFAGHDDQLGDVTYEGKLDAKALDRVRAGGASEPVLGGTLKALGQSVTKAYVWFGGD